jgi:hypothetical protein
MTNDDELEAWVDEQIDLEVEVSMREWDRLTDFQFTHPWFNLTTNGELSCMESDGQEHFYVLRPDGTIAATTPIRPVQIDTHATTPNS